MSTVQAEKAITKPLGSFLGKLSKSAEKPVEKPAEKVAEKSVEQPATPQEAEAKTEALPVGATDAKADTKPTELKTDEKPKDDKTEKRLKDAQTWGNEEHKARLDAERKNAELQAQLVRIEAKLDGTYEEPTTPSAEQVKADADLTGRIKASHKAAVRLHSEEHVMKTVWAPDSLYQKLQAGDPRIRARVMESDAPVLEALDVVKEHQDAERYGRTPEEIRKRMEAELAPKLKQDLLDGLKTKPGPATNTLGDVRGGTERTEQKNTTPNVLNLGTVFPWGAKRT